MLNFRRRSVLLLALALPLIVNFSGVSAQEPTILKIATPSDTTTGLLDPHREVSIAMQRYAHNLYDSLLQIDYLDGWKLKPALAISWERTGDRTLKLTLRDGVHFHDGSEMTAEDVVFSLSPDRLLSEDWPGAGAMKRLWGGIESVEALDSHTVQFTTREIDPQLEYRLAANGSQILSKSAFETSASIEEWSKAPVGTGPFEVTEFRPGELAVYERFDAYWDELPAVNQITWQVVPEIATRVAGLATGEFDLITNVDPDQIDLITSKDDIEVVGGPIANHHILIFDTQNPWLADIRMRRALSLAIDRKLIVQTLWGGRTSIPKGYQFEEYGDLYVADHPEISYDLAEAKRLVSETDYNGEPIPFNITNNYYTTEIPRAEAMVSMWKSAGINVKIKINEDFSHLNGGIRNGATRLSYPDPVGSIVRTWGRSSYWDNQGVMASISEREEFFKIADDISSTIDPKKRQQQAAQILAFFDEHLPTIPLHREAAFYGKRKSINWTPSSSPAMEFRASNLSIGK